MPAEQRFDALFVINQNVDLARLAHSWSAAKYCSVLVLTTHKLFENELILLGRAAPQCKTLVTSFSDWLDDSELEDCDRKASAMLLSGINAPGGRWFYAMHFAAASAYFKNAAVHSAVRRRYECSRVHYLPGLGVSASYWREQKASEIHGAPREARALPETLRRIWARVKFLLRATTLYRVTDHDRDFLFTSVRRLSFKPDEQPKPLLVGPGKKALAALTSSTTAPARILQHLIGHDALLCTTIHDYPTYLSENARPVHVFIDGFHPSNYPRAYFDQYGSCVFVTTDPLSVEWFRKHGGTVIPPPPFLWAAPMKMPEQDKRIRRVLLALNHAGDWTALINRSDTDVLVEAFCRAAAAVEELEFVVRPHPTMVHSSHEGCDSLERIKEFVRTRGLANLEVSTVGLQEDLERSDLVISEYSQVLIDAFRAGKLGLIANFTRRRSFMADYASCGFASVSDEAAFIEYLHAASRDPSEAVRRQMLAVTSYNEKFAALLASGRK